MKLLAFLENNHDLVKSYHRKWYKKETVLCEDARSKIIILFISALNASNAKGKLNNMGVSIEKMRNRIGSLVGNELAFPDFTKAILSKSYQSTSKEAIESLFREFIKGYKQVGPKKATLFLRDLLYTGGEDIFSDVVPSVIWPMLIVPVDKVVGDLLNVYFGFKKLNDEWSTYLMEKYPGKHMYFEDLWFWGHFGTKISTNERFFEKNGNGPMFFMDSIMATMPSEYIIAVKNQIKIFADLTSKS